MAKQRIGRRKAVCLDCGHEWWAKEGTETPARCTLRGCRGRNVVWSDTITPAELAEIRKRTRSEILKLGGQAQPEPQPQPEPEEPSMNEEPEQEPYEEPEQTKTAMPTQEDDWHEVPNATTKVRTVTHKQPLPPNHHTKRNESGQFMKRERRVERVDKVDKTPVETEYEQYDSFEDVVNNAASYRGFNPIFIIVLGGIALIGAFIFLRGKAGITAPQKTIVEAQPAPAAEPVAPTDTELVYPGLRLGGGLFA